jgi:Ca2+-binding RTX toxin-like protein
MNPRTRLAVLVGATLLSASWLTAGGVATASTPLLSCDGLQVTIQVPAPNMVTNGGVGADVILGTAGHDVINGLGGDDHICALDGDDDMTGGTGDDRLDGGEHIRGDRGDGGSHPNGDGCVRTEIMVRCNP